MKKTVLLTIFAAAWGMAPRLAGQAALNPNASRVVGQPVLQIRSTAPNVVEGRELLSPWSVAVDQSITPSPLYVADTGNHRILGWRNAASFGNGATADIVIGQNDRFSTLPGGPETSRSIGLNTPGAVVVDRAGNLYVADIGNNRVLRYPRPFTQSAELITPDLVIGQRSFTTRAANAGQLLPSAGGIALASSSSVARTGLAIDPSGNLWLSDALNNRVLRYPKGALDLGANGMDADLVLGQINFEDSSGPDGSSTRLEKRKLRNPSGIAFDNGGRLFVGDGFVRVVIFAPPFSNGMNATRILGVNPAEPNARPVSEYSIGNANNPVAPEGVFSLGSRMGVVDTGNHRVLIYEPFEQYEVESATRPSPPARIVIGQSDAAGSRRNRGQADPSASGLSEPLSAYFHNDELYVADTGNNRVLAFNQLAFGAAAVRVLGQDNFTSGAPNLLEGKEMFLFSGFGPLGANEGGGIVLDTRGSVPRLYVADSFNNRILGYRDARLVKPGDRADLVIGQSDFAQNLINAPNNDANLVSVTGLLRPSGLAIDAQGNLWVADSGNGRVLRFPSPFEQGIAIGQRHQPSIVIGQSNFTTKIIDATPRNMSIPFGVAVTSEGHLVVSDAAHSRVLFFRRPPGGDFSNGQAAERVLGQPDFFSTNRGGGINSLDRPRGIAVDSGDRLYVADTPNNRVQIYDRSYVDRSAGNNSPPSFTLGGLASPQGVFVSSRTGEIWVANTRASRALRYPQFTQLIRDPRADYELFSGVPLALAQDTIGNVFVAEGTNRVAVFFNGLLPQNAASFNERAVAPGLILSIYPRSQEGKFGDETAQFSSLPLPRQLGDVQVLVNDIAAPLYYVSPGQINLLVPMATPTSGTAEIQVVRVSTQQILASFPVTLAPVAPGLFVNQALPAGGGQIAALNEDNSVNSAANPISRGRVLQLFGTGQGFIANAPPDGSTPSGLVRTDERPRVLIGTDFVDDADVQFSGLSPQFPGVWQINVRVPDRVPPGNQIDVVVLLRSAPSNRGPNDRIIRTTVAVRQ